MDTSIKNYISSFAKVVRALHSLSVMTILLLFLVSCPMFGQDLEKKPVTEKDYHLWGTLYIDKVSDDGRWVSYLMDYDEDPDTLFVKSTDAEKTFRYVNAGEGRFIGNTHFACIDAARNLQLRSLRDGIVRTFKNIESYAVSKNNRYLVLYADRDGTNSIQIMDLVGNLKLNIEGVNGYEMNPASDKLTCLHSEDGKDTVTLIGLSEKITATDIMASSELTFSHTVWHSRSDSFAIIASQKIGARNSLYFYSLIEKRLSALEDSHFRDTYSEYEIKSGYASALAITSDGKGVAFTLRRKQEFAKSLKGLQQWKTSDAMVYPERQLILDSEFNSMTLLWSPSTDKITCITDTTTPFGFLNASYSHAISYNPSTAGPQYVTDPKYDLFVTDLKSGEKKLLVEKQSIGIGQISLSPGGKYLAYYSKGDWWLYDFTSQERRNVTKGHEFNFINSDDASWKGTYRVAGWGKDDDYILICDKYDIWKFDFTGAPRKITDGRAANITYEIVPPRQSEFSSSNHRGHVDLPIDLSKEILLRTTTANETGYTILKPGGTIKNIVSDANLNKDIIKAAKADTYIFQSQNYSTPPQIRIVDGNCPVPKKIFQSNEQFLRFAWGKQETVSFKNNAGNTLNALLYYPAGYDPAKKYPMVVHVYEQLTYMMNYYFNPSLYNGAGFNIANLTSEGYFVLMPDIQYTIGNPGISATDCVTAATKQVIASGMIIGDKIALIGQSFGGYETNFIVTQTNMFATAISSASIFDLNSFYFSIGETTMLPEMWRMEDQQWRMGKSLFEDRKAYFENSPSNFVENINTPMLIWAGELDKHVNPNQSIGMYLALRRLNKQGALLIFPGDSHSLLIPENQKELNRRVNDWLAYHLKNETSVNWISEETK